MSDDRSDTALLIASRTDPVPFGVLYERWSERVLAYFYRRTWDPQVSADLVAETFAVAWLKRDRFRDTGRPGSAWLFGIARRELGRYRRHRGIHLRAVARLGVEVPPLGDDSIERIDEIVDADAYRADLAAALSTLSDGEREAVRLRVVDDRPFRDVGAELGCSEGAARVRVHRALKKLAETVEAPT
ncbi:MAG: sigma-70 family RNA polymerase sigma factor [Actinomycetota bacterium]